jgi:hypothetical protein
VALLLWPAARPPIVTGRCPDPWLIGVPAISPSPGALAAPPGFGGGGWVDVERFIGLAGGRGFSDRRGIGGTGASTIGAGGSG